MTLSSESGITHAVGPWFRRILSDTTPDVIINTGYHEWVSQSAILAFRERAIQALLVLWSETTEGDHTRWIIREYAKTVLVKTYDGALVAGSPHARYLQKLGMREADIGVVGNCVDNEVYTRRAHAARALAAHEAIRSEPREYFLYVGRFVAQKNLTKLVKAYGRYRKERGPRAWDLVLVGSGPDETRLKDLVRRSAIDGVQFHGLKQIDELPRYYGLAKCLVLASITEPWGLVVNEAMASGLPVLVSNRCGCVEDLVQHGVNGFIFDPDNERGLSELMASVSGGDAGLDSMGQKGREIVERYTPERFAERASSHLQALYIRKRRDAQVFPNYSLRAKVVLKLMSMNVR